MLNVKVNTLITIFLQKTLIFRNFMDPYNNVTDPQTLFLGVIIFYILQNFPEKCAFSMIS